MAQAALFVSPMARKKQVLGKYNPDSFRVISGEAENHLAQPRILHVPSLPKCNIIGQARKLDCENEYADGEHRYNRPNATNVGFLRQDVRLLNEPLCTVQTENTRKENEDWWPSRVSCEPLVEPPHTLDTTVRDDFQWRGQHFPRVLRNSSNPNKNPAVGGAPVNTLRDPSGKQRFWKEGISYEHQYNCRLDPQYPIRGKRHGSFVWDKFSDKKVDQMVEKYHYNKTQSPTTRQAEVREVEMLPDSVPSAERREVSTGSPPAAVVSASSLHSHQSLGSPPDEKTEAVPPVGT